MAKHNDIGKIGENITCVFLMKHGFNIKTRNESIRYGEIDIIATKNNTIHFVEVKSIDTPDINNVSNLSIKPEDNFTQIKRDKLKRTINLYLSSNKTMSDVKIYVDLACVYINYKTREGRVRFLENIEI